MDTAADHLRILDAANGLRGSVALVTQQTRQLDPLRCEVCNIINAGGVARGVILEEPGVDSTWLLWVLADGWSVSDHGDIAVCSSDQSDPLLRVIRFAESE